MPTGRPAKSQRSELGKRLTAARLRRRLTQTEVASRVGVSQQAYAGWERRTLAMRPEHIANLARVLGLGLEELLGVEAVARESELPTGRAFDLFLRVGRLPKDERTRVLDVVEDLLSAARKRRKR